MSINSKSTKEAILTAFNELKGKYENIMNSKVDPAKEVKIKEETTIKETAKEVVSPDLCKLSKELQDFVSRLSSITQDYKTVEQAIEIESKELEEIYGIKKEASTLFALVNSKEDMLQEYNDQMQKAKLTWEEKIQELKDNHDTRKKEFEQERTRAKEEYDYTFGREKKAKEDALKDSLASIKKTHDTECESERADAEKTREALDVREATIKASEDKLAMVEELQKALAESKENSKTKSIEINSLKKDNEHTIALLKKEHEGTVALLENKIEALTKALEESRDNNSKVAERLDNAYTNVKEIANQSVNGANNNDIINTLKDVATSKDTKNSK